MEGGRDVRGSDAEIQSIIVRNCYVQSVNVIFSATVQEILTTQTRLYKSAL